MKNWVTALDSLMTSLRRGSAVFLKILLFQTLQRKISSLQFVWLSGLEVSCFRQGSLDNDGHDWVNTFERVQSLQSVYGNVQRLNVIYSHRAESRLCDAIFSPFIFVCREETSWLTMRTCRNVLYSCAQSKYASRSFNCSAFCGFRKRLRSIEQPFLFLRCSESSLALHTTLYYHCRSYFIACWFCSEAVNENCCNRSMKKYEI